MSAVFYVNLAISGIVQGLVIALAALAINLVFSVARFSNAAGGDFLTVGAYSAILLQGLGVKSVWLQGLGAIVITSVVTVLSFLLVFRRLAGRSMVAPLVASIGLAFLMRYVITFFVGQNQYSFNLPIVRAANWNGIRILPNDLWLVGIAIITLASVFAILFFTPIGRRLRAVADDADLARASGIRADRVMLFLWLMVGVLSAVAGIILGIKTVVVPEIGWNILLPAFAAAVLGGIGSLPGAVVAGILLGMAQELSSPFVGFTYDQAIAFIVLVIVLAIRPQGFFGTLERVR